MEPTVPWEESADKAYEQKHLRYAELTGEAHHHGWKTEVCPMEARCRSFVATSTTRLFRDQGIRGQSLHLAIKSALKVREKKPMVLEEDARPLLGPKVAGQDDTEGGVLEMPEFTPKPSRDVMGSSTGHQGGRVPTLKLLCQLSIVNKTLSCFSCRKGINTISCVFEICLTAVYQT